MIISHDILVVFPYVFSCFLFGGLAYFCVLYTLFIIAIFHHLSSVLHQGSNWWWYPQFLWLVNCLCVQRAYDATFETQFWLAESTTWLMFGSAIHQGVVKSPKYHVFCKLGEKNCHRIYTRRNLHVSIMCNRNDNCYNTDRCCWADFWPWLPAGLNILLTKKAIFIAAQAHQESCCFLFHPM